MKNIGKKLFLLSFILFAAISFSTGMQSSYKVDMGDLGLKKSETQGAWIIIAGSRFDYDKQEIIDNGCNITYQVLISKGYSADDIYYLGNTSYSIVDASATRANIQWAIETWAAGKCDDTNGLGIYMFDHGGIDYFCLHPNPDLTAANLDSYLDNFETNSGSNRTILIYEACHSGSFIDEVSQDNRIVITATDVNHGSKVNGDWTWAAFSEGFWNSIKECNTIGEAFEDGVENVDDLGYSGAQFPWIDDDHDGIGHEANATGELPNGGDGNDALSTTIGSPLSCYLRLIIKKWPRRLFFDPTVNVIPLWVLVESDVNIRKVYARVVPPSYIPQPPENDIGEGVRFDGLAEKYLIPLYDYNSDGNYTADPKSAGVDPEWSWNETHELKINFFARGDDGEFSDVGTTKYFQTSDGNPPLDTTPPIVEIINPKQSGTLTGNINLIAEAEDDQNIYKIRLLLDGQSLTTQIFDTNPFEISFNLNTASYSNGQHNITAIAWDDSGNNGTTSLLVNFDNQVIPSFQFTPVLIGCFLAVIVSIIAIHKNNEKLLKF